MMDTRVLLIDNDRKELSALARYLRTVAKIEVEPCENGPAALDHLRAGKLEYTAALLDYVLNPQEMSAGEVLTEIREHHPQLPVIVFTGKDPARGVQVLSAGAYGYLPKPLDRAKLVNMIRNLREQEAVFRQMAHEVRQTLGSDMCLAWRLDRRARRFQIVAWDGDRDLDADYRHTTFLDPSNPHTRHVFEHKRPYFLSDVTDRKSAPHYLHPEYAKKQGWTSLISIPLVYQDRTIGLVDSYTRTKITDEQQRDEWLHTVLPRFARRAALEAWNVELSNRLQALQGLNDVLAGTYDEGTILRQILAKALELVGADTGWVYRLDVNKGTLVLKKSMGVNEDDVGRERSLGEGITGQAARSGEALNVADVADPASGLNHREIPGLAVRSVIAVPLRRGEQVTGAMAVTSPLAGAFTGEDVSLLSSLSAQAAVAMGRADVTKHSQELGRLALKGDYDGLAAYVVEAARDLTGADVILWTVSEVEDERGQWLRIKACKGEFRGDYATTAKTPTPPGSSITALALERGAPIVRRDVQDKNEAPDEPPFFNGQAANDHNWHGFMAVPLLGHGRVPLGSLSLYGKEVAKFGDAEVGLMQAFADQVVIALQNAQWRKLVPELATIGEDIGQLAAEEPKRTLSRIAYSAWEDLGADCVVIYPYDQARTDFFDLTNVAHFGLTHPLELADQPRSKGVAAQVLEKGTLPIGDVSAYTELKLDHPLLQRERIRAFLGLSLRSEGEPVGVMYVNFRSPHPLTDRDRDRAQEWAGKAADAIRKGRQSDTGMTLTAFLQAFAERARELLAADSIVLYQYRQGRDHHERRNLEFVTPPVVAGQVRNSVPMRRQVYDNDAPAVLIRYDKPFYADDVTSDEFTALLNPTVEERDGQPSRPRFLQREGICSSAGVFLRAADETVGVMFVNYRTPHAFTDDLKQRIDLLANQAAVAIHNARIFEQAQILQEITERIAESTLKQQTMFELVLERALDAIGFSKGWISLLQADANLLKMKAARGLDPQDWKDLSKGEGITGHVAETGEPLNVPDVNQVPFYKPFYPGTVSELCVPLKYRDNTVGIINVESALENAFTPRDEEVLATLARATAIAMENAGLYEQLRSTNRQLNDSNKQLSTASKRQSAVSELGRQLTASIELSEAAIIELLHKQASVVMDTNNMFIALYDQPTDSVRFALAYVDGRRVDTATEFGWGPRSGGHGMTEEIIRTRQPRIITTRAQSKEAYDPDTGHTNYIKRGFASWLGVPMAIGERVLGVIATYHATLENLYGENDELVLGMMASYAAVALDNARLVHELKGRVTELDKIRELSEELSAGVWSGEAQKPSQEG